MTEGGCHRARLSQFHTLFTAHYHLSITCNYPSWWLMECFRGWVGKRLGLSCWGLHTITQSLNTARYEDNLRDMGVTCQWLGCIVCTSGLFRQAVIIMLCCIQENDSRTNAWAVAAALCQRGLQSVRVSKSPAQYFIHRVLLCKACFTN